MLNGQDGGGIRRSCSPVPASRPRICSRCKRSDCAVGVRAGLLTAAEAPRQRRPRCRHSVISFRQRLRPLPHRACRRLWSVGSRPVHRSGRYALLPSWRRVNEKRRSGRRDGHWSPRRSVAALCADGPSADRQIWRVPYRHLVDTRRDGQMAGSERPAPVLREPRSPSMSPLTADG